MWLQRWHINELITRWSQVALKVNKIKPDWVGKRIYCKLRKILNFDLIDRWYMHKSESVQENETHKVIWDFEITTFRPED